ncbi:MAG: helix-turn-helix transcriptional regulator [Clostridiales bacterium]|nr:helix-turn-helix transcriptional regulator [Clostridiales bacterium]
MFKNKNADGKLNLCGKNVARLRMAAEPKMSQKGLANQLQLVGLDLEKNAVQRIESGQRFVTDIELQKLAEVLGVSTDELIRG